MKKLSTMLAAACAGLVLAGAGGATVFGVADDTGKNAADGGAAFFAQLNDVGLSSNRMTVLWDPSNPRGSADLANVDRALPQAALLGIRVVLAVYPLRPNGITGSPGAAGQFVAFLQTLAQSHPQVKDYIVGNEPNQPRFWQPQFNPGGSGAAGPAYEALLASSYDALKAVDPSINVIGLGLSPRGNDDPHASDNVSTSPVRFIHDLGVAYRASGRTLPLIDQLSFHPYPNEHTDPLSKGYPWPKAGLVNLDRIKQAVWDAFNGTGQPVFQENVALASARSGQFLTLRLDEVGWQVGVLPSAAAAYHGRESVRTTDEATQAQIYGDIVGSIECDPTVTELQFFGLYDEPDLDRFQAGLIRADGTRRASYDTVKGAIAATGGRCGGRPVSWRHVTSILGAAVRFGIPRRPVQPTQRSWGFTATADEDALYRAGIFRVRGSGASRSALRSTVSRSLASSSAARLVLGSTGRVKAYWSPLVRFPSRRLRAGWYAYGIRLSAAMNPARKALFLSAPFRVGRPGLRH